MNTKIKHCLCVDDQKTYLKSSAKVTTLTNRLEGMFSDIGLDWVIRKCSTIHTKGGKLQNTENLPLTGGTQIPVLGEEDHYKLLGKLQNVKHLDKQVFEQASQEYLRRLAAIWTSHSSYQEKLRPQTRLLTQFCNIICGQVNGRWKTYKNWIERPEQ